MMLDYDRTRYGALHDNSRGPTAPGEVAETTAKTAAGIPLAVLGGPLFDADRSWFDLVERAGGQVVLDATEGGRRTLPRPFDPARIALKPLDELADAYFDGIADAFRRPNSGLYEWLERQLAANHVRGILLRRYVWCDLWHAEAARLKQWSAMPLLELDVGPDDLARPAACKGESRLSWKCSSERSAPKNRLSPMGPAVRGTARGGTARTGLRRTAAPTRRSKAIGGW